MGTKIIAQLVPEDDRGFARFWAAYPKRVAKKDARKAWATLNPTSALVDRMIEALTWQSRLESWVRDGYAFAPYPASWLRAERWDDEPPPVNGRGHEPAFIPWESADCPHVEAHDSKYRCWQATQLGRPRKAEAKLEAS